jgi:hypothetical protein
MQTKICTVTKKRYMELETGDKVYELYPYVAYLIKDMALGQNGLVKHTMKRISMEITGQECKIVGRQLCLVAAFTLKEDVRDWDI